MRPDVFGFLESANEEYRAMVQTRLALIAVIMKTGLIRFRKAATSNA